MKSREYGQANNVLVVCDKCNERHRGTTRIITHIVNGKEVFYTSKLCHKCEGEENK